MNITKKIRELRENKGMSQAELAKAAGLSTTYISLMESGKKSPTLKSLEKISTALDIPFPVLSFMSLSEEDIPVEKRSAFRLLGPSVNAMIKEFFLKEVS